MGSSRRDGPRGVLGAPSPTDTGDATPRGQVTPTWPALLSGPRLIKLLLGFLEPGELPGPLARRGALICGCRLGSWNKALHAVT